MYAAKNEGLQGDKEGLDLSGFVRFWKIVVDFQECLRYNISSKKTFTKRKDDSMNSKYVEFLERQVEVLEERVEVLERLLEMYEVSVDDEW